MVMGPGAGQHTRHDPGEQQLRSRLRGALFGETAIPVKVGRYVVIEELGAGGLGVVYAAYDPKLDRRVALKLINPARVGIDATQRMQREAQAMARLSHPNVVTVHDTGAHESGVFIAMELIDGPTLSKWVQGRPPAWRAERDVLVEAGQGLVAAHREGLIHRDFKPANVLVDDAGHPHVLDFGLACAADEVFVAEPTEATTSLLGDAITETGVLLGTPQYMSPEQFAGRADARSDQWAFCVTAWEVLYRRRPFTAPDIPSLRHVIESGHIPPTSPDSSVPGWLDRALRRGLSVDPAQRFASMEALLSALQRDKRSRRMQILGLAVTVVLSGAAAGTAVWLTRPAVTEQSRERVDSLVSQARASAEAGHFVYPPVADPQSATAFASVVALEQLTGPIADDAREQATMLRGELATTLVALADAYADREGGEGFAADYYAAALLFDPGHERAREQSTLTAGELSMLRRRAERAEFSSRELEGAQVLAALAEPDEPARLDKVAALYQRDRLPAASTSLHLEKLLGREPLQRVRRRAGPAKAAAAAPPGDSPTPPQLPVEAPTETDPDTKAVPSSATTPPSAATSKAAANAAAKAGRAALSRGDDTTAEQAFHRALGHDRRHLGALLGLTEVLTLGTQQAALRPAHPPHE
ncbi:MAG: serine/threonine protein kinase [Deltaproteobacteria bacterium]|nr:serine/threonine protein kinase [Deltaproteobacteria bacterium]